MLQPAVFCSWASAEKQSSTKPSAQLRIVLATLQFKYGFNLLNIIVFIAVLVDFELTIIFSIYANLS